MANVRCYNGTDITTFIIIVVIWFIFSCVACYLSYKLGGFIAYKKFMTISAKKSLKIKNISVKRNDDDYSEIRKTINVSDPATTDKNKEINCMHTYDTAAKETVLYHPVTEDVTVNSVQPSAPIKNEILDSESDKLERNVYEN